MIDSQTKKIAVLGEGITAKSVKQKVSMLADFEISTVEVADLVVASPGIPPSAYPETTVEIISEVEFAYQLFHRAKSTYAPKLIGITGTNGKSTVTSLLAHVLCVKSAGNIGVPLIDYVDRPESPPILIVELSSYQLERIKHFKSDIAVLLNIEQDHLERHKSMQQYATEKLKITQNLTAQDLFFYPENNRFVEHKLSEILAKKYKLSMSDPLFAKLKKIQTQGNHGRMNALVAYLVATTLNLSHDTTIQRINSYEALPHRLETVFDHNGRLFINDSKATNLHATQAAIDVYTKPVHLILCGQDKGLNLASFIGYLINNVASIVLWGEISERMSHLIHKKDPTFNVIQVMSLSEAVQSAYAQSKEDSIILFSPSSSSQDVFDNFEHRGKAFKQEVTALYG